MRNRVLVKAARHTFVCLAGAALFALPAAAGPNDIHLPGLVKRDAGSVTVRHDDFRLLVHELALVMTPPSLQPAETTGQSGFDFALEYGAHDISEQETYWSDAVEGKLENRELLPVLQTLGVRGRKGFPLPIPLSSEVDLGVQWIADSSMFSLGGNVRLALNEGFRWIPDLAVMTGINQLIGADDMNLTTVTVGGSVSKGFGVFGSFALVPFVSYQSIFLNGSTRVLDPDPSSVEDVGNNIVFNEVKMQEDDGSFKNRIDRVSAGLRVNVALVQLSAGVDFNVMPEDASGNRRLFMQYAARAGLYF